jgi:regulator of nucleoside diphosphate kinase
MTSHDHDRLSVLAAAVASRRPDIGEFLMRELDRAKVVAPERIGAATVAMGSCVEFAYGHSASREVATLVFPGEENIAMGRVSILTPVGAALIGLSEGQSIAFRTLRGEERTLTVLKVRRPAADR